MGMLAPAFLAALAAIAIPVLIHMIHRERRETTAFPSLMFLRKIPYQSVRRQKLRHLMLLALRCLAIVIVAAAFARPFLDRRLAIAPSGSDAREVVIALDRSYSMAHGERWSRAISAVGTIAGDIRPSDRVSLVTFAAGATQLTEPTNDAARIERAAATTRPGSELTRIGAGLRMAAQILSASELPRKEIVLISDFHRFGWKNDDVALPAGSSLKAVDVSRGETADLAASHVAVARVRERSGDRARATVTARVTNLGAIPASTDATLELAGRRLETRRVTIPARSSAQVVFAPAVVPAAPTRGVVRLSPDSQPTNDAFFFVVAEEVGASALIIEPPGPRGNQSLYLSRALAVADDPEVRVDVKSAAAVTAADVRDRSFIVMNEADVPAALAAQIRSLVEEGALLLVAPGERGSGGWTPEWRALLPASVGAVTDRPEGARWASADFSNALFEPFRASGADFSSVTANRYRTLTPSPEGSGAQVIARFDDGAPLLVERPLGRGRILMWASSLDALWTDLPFHPLWVPFLHQLSRRSLSGREARSWVIAPHVLDLSRERTGDAIVESPSGERLRVADQEGGRIELRDRGFYEVRNASTAIGAGRPIAVNVDLAESDLSHVDPAELVAGVTARAQRGAADVGPAPLTDNAQELERRQAIWWYLLLGAALLLASETMLANRLSRSTAARHATAGRVS